MVIKDGWRSMVFKARLQGSVSNQLQNSWRRSLEHCVPSLDDVLYADPFSWPSRKRWCEQSFLLSVASSSGFRSWSYYRQKSRYLFVREVESAEFDSVRDVDIGRIKRRQVLDWPTAITLSWKTECGSSWFEDGRSQVKLCLFCCFRYLDFHFLTNITFGLVMILHEQWFLDFESVLTIAGRQQQSIAWSPPNPVDLICLSQGQSKKDTIFLNLQRLLLRQRHARLSR